MKAQHVRDRLSRREAMIRLAGAGLGAAAVLRGGAGAPGASAQEAAAPTAGRRVVQTVRGPLDTAKLGFTLSHEHICGGSPGLWQAWPELYGGRANFVRDAVEALKRARDEGVESIVDVTTFDLGRDIRLLEEVSRKSGMQVIACTGHWLDVSRAMNVRTVDELTDFFTREITVGIEGTDIKAGVIKVANAAGEMTPFGEKLLRAAARASKATGVPITTHAPAADRVGDRQAAVFESEGLSPSNVCIGHSDSGDGGYLSGLIRRGYYLGMDQVPFGAPPAPGTLPPPTPPASFEARIAAIRMLVDAGFARRLMLSNDWLLAMAYQPTANEPARRARNPDGFLFVTRKAIPALKAGGVADQAIRTMTVEAPRRFFEGA